VELVQAHLSAHMLCGLVGDVNRKGEECNSDLSSAGTRNFQQMIHAFSISQRSTFALPTTSKTPFY
jgi:hypothetical protein